MILIPFVTKWSKKYNIVFFGDILMFHLHDFSKIKNLILSFEQPFTSLYTNVLFRYLPIILNNLHLYILAYK